MEDKKPCDFIKIFSNSSTRYLEEEINEWLNKNPDFYLDQMSMMQSSNNSYSVICDFCLRDEESKEEENLKEELLKGLIGAVNELTDAVKNIDRKTENSIM